MNQLGARRRQFLAGVAGASGAALWAHTAETKPHTAETKPHAADIPPTEDLMREHGILRRVLLVYEEGARRLSAGDATVLDAVAGAASIIRRFVEGYHEKLEEDFVFPRLEKAGKLVDLTTVLRVQHGAGRKLTDAILDGARAGKAAGADRRRTMLADIDSFIRMYQPHAAWEDTELFPVFRGLYSERELDKLGDRFEEQEHALLGAGGFEGSLKGVRDLEAALGIADLAKFTPTPR
jgi:hemerythrin-like domain-containing protein